MKKTGFTLAEVLITLGIIGVVAALTTPSLVNNIGDAKLGPSLSKFNNTFSNAVALAMERSGITQFHSNSIALLTEIGLLSNHIIMVPYEGTYTFTDAIGTNLKNVESNSRTWQNYLDTQANPNHTQAQLDAIAAQLEGTPIVNRLNNGSVMVIVPINNAVSEVNGVFKGAVAEVLIDIDGDDNGNNRAGADVFGFLLDASGVLIPAGSAAHKYVNQSGPTYIGNYTDQCNNGVGDLQRNFACTGRIADNNWSTKGISLE